MPKNRTPTQTFGEQAVDQSLDVTAIVHREKDGTYAYRFTGTTLSGTINEILIPRDAARCEVQRLLKRRGFHLQDCSIQEDVSLPLVIEAAQVGWRPDRKGFVTFAEAIGAFGAHSVIPPRGVQTGAPGVMKKRGSLRGFQTKIAPAAKRSTTLMLTLCASFAAPLLSLLEVQPFGLVLFGPSRSGKSTAQLYAASTIGAGKQKDLCNLTATDNSLIETATLFNDHLFVLDELGTAGKRKKDVGEMLYGATYQLLCGRDKMRFSAYTDEIGQGPNLTSSSILLLSSERSPDDWAAHAGIARDDGEKVRLIGVPVIEGCSTTIMDRPPKRVRSLDEAEQRKWAKKELRRLFTRLPRERGHAFPAFVKFLAADTKKAAATVRTHIKRFEDATGELGGSEVEAQIISHFGIIFAAGAIACEAGILPFSPDLVHEMILARCRSALGAVPDPNQVLRENLAQLRRQLDRCILTEQRDVNKLTDAPGFRRDNKQCDLVIRAEKFLGWFKTRHDSRLVLEWLDDKGFLKGTKERPKKATDFGWAKSQPLWPDGSRPRSIEIRLPNSLKDLRISTI